MLAMVFSLSSILADVSLEEAWYDARKDAELCLGATWSFCSLQTGVKHGATQGCSLYTMFQDAWPCSSMMPSLRASSPACIRAT